MLRGAPVFRVRYPLSPGLEVSLEDPENLARFGVPLERLFREQQFTVDGELETSSIRWDQFE
jgi:hypothetical protein